MNLRLEMCEPRPDMNYDRRPIDCSFNDSKIQRRS